MKPRWRCAHAPNAHNHANNATTKTLPRKEATTGGLLLLYNSASERPHGWLLPDRHDGGGWDGQPAGEMRREWFVENVVESSGRDVSPK